ncbi:MAG: 3-oxoacyl-ACP synthase [Treponema sp.]|jgi:3-oxoacyl-[acyl-carrier-protein] synthase-1|nr:3-oxoacyl-ACP synthase [Treponema sp.]
MGMGIFLSKPGLVSCAGKDALELYDSVTNGSRRGIKNYYAPNGKSYPSGLVEDISGLDADMPPSLPYPPSFCGNTKIMKMTGAALRQIRPFIENAKKRYGNDRIGVCAGSCDNGSEASVLAHKKLFKEGAFPKDFELRFQSAPFLAECVSALAGVSGPSLAIAAACASSAVAIARGAELINAGFCDAVIAGGADLVSDSIVMGFSSLESLSDTLCNPFSKNRKGINLGEGAAFFLLCREDTGLGIELAGYGASSDAFHMTAPEENGNGAKKAMRDALKASGLGADEIDYINLHGTGTPLNDKAEGRAIEAVFSSHKNRPLVSSTKPVTGHTLGAAGAIEAAICVELLVKRKSYPPHLWDGVFDSDIPSLAFAGKNESAKNIYACMSNSFAFGGCNVSLVFKRKTRQ